MLTCEASATGDPFKYPDTTRPPLNQTDIFTSLSRNSSVLLLIAAGHAVVLTVRQARSGFCECKLVESFSFAG